MPGANDIARADDSDSQFAVIFLCHVSNTGVDLALRLTIARVNFDELDRVSVQQSLDNRPPRGTFCAPISCAMSKVCTITGSRPTRGSVIHRRGMAKKKGGVGRHVTKNVSRLFVPNLHEHRIWVPELKKFVRVRVTARGLKTINKNGAYKSLKKVGAI